MKPIQVVSWTSKNEIELLSPLAEDCRRLGYSFYGETIHLDKQSRLQEWAHKPIFIRECLQRFEKVLYCDRQMRLWQNIPASWWQASVMVPLFKPDLPIKHLLRRHTGIMVWSREQLPLLNAWINLLQSWNLENIPEEYADDRPCGGNVFLSDGAALDCALTVLNISPESPQMSWKLNDQHSPLRVGGRGGANTIASFGLLHHWTYKDGMDPKRSYYQIFRMHFSGDIKSVEAAMEKGLVLRNSGWVFDGKSRKYAPEEFYPEEAKDWLPYLDPAWSESSLTNSAAIH